MQVLPDSDAISVMISIPHTEGSLYRLLTKFYVNDMNLLRIESRPVKNGSFEVKFFLDFSGRITDPNVKAVMKDLQEMPKFSDVSALSEAETDKEATMSNKFTELLKRKASYSLTAEWAQSSSTGTCTCTSELSI